MRRLLMFGFLLTTLLALVCAILVLSARITVSKNVKYALLNDCTLPCFAGAIVGKSDLNDAFQKLSARLDPESGFVLDNPPFARGDENSFFWRRHNMTFGTEEGISAGFVSKILTDITVRFDLEDASTPKLGDLLAYYGLPSCVEIAMNGNYVLLYLHHDYVLTVAQTDLNLNGLVAYITIDGGTDIFDCQRYSAFKWQGFASNRYSP
jgi:hypothetical protein